MDYITEIRKKVLKFSNRMSTEEMINWNEMMQNPNPEKTVLESFLKTISNKYKNKL